jgi:hypothetical protein
MANQSEEIESEFDTRQRSTFPHVSMKLFEENDLITYPLINWYRGTIDHSRLITSQEQYHIGDVGCWHRRLFTCWHIQGMNRAGLG